MSKSLEFCQKVASNPNLSAFAHRDWTQAIEEESEPYFDEELEGCRSIGVNANENDEVKRYGLEITFDPDGDFSYYTSTNYVFHKYLSREEMRSVILENIEECIKRILSASTYDTFEGRPENGNTIHYTIGNFVLLCECEINNENYRNEITVLLPLRTRILREGIL